MRIAQPEIFARVGFDDTLDQRMPHDVVRTELDKLGSGNAFEHTHDVLEARLAAARQIGLRDSYNFV